MYYLAHAWSLPLGTRFACSLARRTFPRTQTPHMMAPAHENNNMKAGHFLFPTCCHDPEQNRTSRCYIVSILMIRYNYSTLPLCAPCGHSRPRRPERLFRAPCTCGCRLPLLKATSQPRRHIASTPPGVRIRTSGRMRLQDPSASRLRRKTEDPALLPPSRPPHAAVNICPFAHTWSLLLTTRPSSSRPAYLPTARNTANVASQGLGIDIEHV